MVLHNALFHTDLNYAFSSRYNSDPLLSSYGWVPSYGIADFAVGIGPRSEKFDVSLVVKNLFDNETSQVVLWNSYVPALPRWFGVTFKGRI